MSPSLAYYGHGIAFDCLGNDKPLASAIRYAYHHFSTSSILSRILMTMSISPIILKRCHFWWGLMAFVGFIEARFESRYIIYTHLFCPFWPREHFLSSRHISRSLSLMARSFTASSFAYTSSRSPSRLDVERIIIILGRRKQFHFMRARRPRRLLSYADITTCFYFFCCLWFIIYMVIFMELKRCRLGFIMAATDGLFNLCGSNHAASRYAASLYRHFIQVAQPSVASDAFEEILSLSYFLHICALGFGLEAAVSWRQWQHCLSSWYRPSIVVSRCDGTSWRWLKATMPPPRNLSM